MDKKLRPGDLVRVRETTHDDNIPEDRHGLIVECATHGPATYTYVWKVLMTNGKTLKFHEMFLVKIKKE